MIRIKDTVDVTSVSDTNACHDDRLVLMDDVMFVNAFAEAASRRGKALVCVGCLDPWRPLRAFVFQLIGSDTVDESAGSLGFCFDCYRDLMERAFNDSISRLPKVSQR